MERKQPRVHHPSGFPAEADDAALAFVALQAHREQDAAPSPSLLPFYGDVRANAVVWIEEHGSADAQGGDITGAMRSLSETLPDSTGDLPKMPAPMPRP